MVGCLTWHENTLGDDHLAPDVQRAPVMSRRRRMVLGVVAALVLAVSLAAFLLVSECAYGGGMAARYKTCKCLGVERALYDTRPADGPHKTVCVGIVRSRTCYRMTDGPIVECPR
jgi:hypothetical protein